MWIWGHAAVVAVVTATLLAAAAIIQSRRSPQSTVAWLLAIVALPYLAVPLFLLVGTRKNRRRFQPLSIADDGHAPPRGSPGDTFHRLGAASPVDGNGFELIGDGQAAFAELISMIETAETRIDAIFYLVAPDATGRGFVDALSRRARDGVRVRLVIDRLGGLLVPRSALAALRAAGGEVRFYSGLFRLPPRGHLNLRNHRKLLIADGPDGLAVFSGGMNIGCDYLGARSRAGRFIDLCCRTSGPVTTDFARLFEHDWDAAAFAAPSHMPPNPARPAARGDRVLQLVAAGPDTVEDTLHDGLVAGIHRTTRRVCIVTPYFLPTEPLTNALGIAARRGVDVEILVPARSNHRIADFARGAYLRELAAAGCRVLSHPSAMVHAKAGLLDDTGYLGSANFDVRSMLLNFEIALVLHDPTSVAALSDWYGGLKAQCTEHPVSAGRLRRVAEGVFRLGAPLL